LDEQLVLFRINKLTRPSCQNCFGKYNTCSCRLPVYRRLLKSYPFPVGLDLGLVGFAVAQTAQYLIECDKRT